MYSPEPTDYGACARCLERRGMFSNFSKRSTWMLIPLGCQGANWLLQRSRGHGLFLREKFSLSYDCSIRDNKNTCMCEGESTSMGPRDCPVRFTVVVFWFPSSAQKFPRNEFPNPLLETNKAYPHPQLPTLHPTAIFFHVSNFRPLHAHLFRDGLQLINDNYSSVRWVQRCTSSVGSIPFPFPHPGVWHTRSILEARDSYWYWIFMGASYYAVLVTVCTLGLGLCAGMQ